MADAMFCAHLDQLEELGVHGDKVDAKIARREFFRRRDLGIEQFGGHRTAGYDAEPAGVADRADEMAFRNPAHRAAENGVIAAEKLGPARHQVVQRSEKHTSELQSLMR